MKKFLPTSLLLLVMLAQCTAQGTWIPLANQPAYHSGGVMILLTDGSVICKTDTCFCDSVGTPKWSRLTPDSHGSYVNGTWDAIADMHYSRVYFSSQVLQDGRIYVAGGEEGNGQRTAEIYQPLTDTWTLLTPPGHTFSDANSEILPDGKIIDALVDIYYESVRGTTIFDPQTNTFSQGPECLRTHNESAWIKLRDSSILFMDGYSSTSERYIPSMNEWVADATAPEDLYDPLGFECGPAFLLPDGRGFFMGSTSHNLFYTPSGNSNPGTWTAASDFPYYQGMPDAAGAMMVNGKILAATSFNPVYGDTVYPHPTRFYEYDYTKDAFTRVSAPGGDSVLAGQSYKANMLDLPNGTVLFSFQGLKQYYVYVPDGSPLAAGKPTISNITPYSCDTFMLTGTLFNGISEGAAYGDDWQMATNYPMVSLTRGSNVYYARTYHWNRTGVQTGSLPDTTWFVVPGTVPAGHYGLVVSANGISSDSISLNFLPCPTSIAQVPLENIARVFPNPAQDEITVQLTNPQPGALYAVTDITGRRIIPATLCPNAKTWNIDISNLAGGMYLLQINVPAAQNMLGGQQVFKVVKE